MLNPYVHFPETTSYSMLELADPFLYHFWLKGPNFYDGWNMEAPMQSPHFFFLLIDHHSFIANIGAISFSLCLPLCLSFFVHVGVCKLQSPHSSQPVFLLLGKKLNISMEKILLLWFYWIFQGAVMPKE